MSNCYIAPSSCVLQVVSFLLTLKIKSIPWCYFENPEAETIFISGDIAKRPWGLWKKKKKMANMS